MSRSDVKAVFEATYGAYPDLSAHGTEGGLYGETGVDAIADSVGAVSPSSSDVFVDLGSGNGKINVAASLLFGFSRSVGYESSATRHEQACRVLDLLKGNSTHKAMPPGFHGSLEFHMGDFTAATWSEADIIFGGLLPDDELMKTLTNKFRQMKQGARILMLKEINPKHLKDIKATGSTNHQLGWTANHPIFSYKRSDGELSSDEIAEKKKAEAQKKLDEDKAKASSALPSSSTSSSLMADLLGSSPILSGTSSVLGPIMGSSSLGTSSSLSSSLTSSISTPSISIPSFSTTSTPMSTADLIASFDKIGKDSLASAGKSYTSSGSSSSSSALDKALENLKKTTAATSIPSYSTPSISAPSTSSFAGSIASISAPSSSALSSTFDDIIGKLKASQGSSFSSSSPTNFGNVLGLSGTTSILGIKMPSQALNLAGFESTTKPSIGLGSLDKLGSIADNLRTLSDQVQVSELQVAEEEQDDAAEEAFSLEQVTTASGRTVYVYKKLAEATEPADSVQVNSLIDAGSLELKHGSTCSASF